MKAGFISLFSRSDFRSQLRYETDLEADSEEYKHVVEQRERFAAAAIAFCLEHDWRFLSHFWQKICSDEGDVVPSKVEVAIEPHRSADLLLQTSRTVCAVEIKIAAKLDSHQNPNSDDFLMPDVGYGHFLSERCKELQCRGRYVILGLRDDLVLRKVDPTTRLHLRKKDTGIP